LYANIGIAFLSKVDLKFNADNFLDVKGITRFIYTQIA